MLFGKKNTEISNLKDDLIVKPSSNRMKINSVVIQKRENLKENPTFNNEVRILSSHKSNDMEEEVILFKPGEGVKIINKETNHSKAAIGSGRSEKNEIKTNQQTFSNQFDLFSNNPSSFAPTPFANYLSDSNSFFSDSIKQPIQFNPNPIDSAILSNRIPQYSPTEYNGGGYDNFTSIGQSTNLGENKIANHSFGDNPYFWSPMLSASSHSFFSDSSTSNSVPTSEQWSGLDGQLNQFIPETNNSLPFPFPGSKQHLKTKNPFIS